MTTPLNKTLTGQTRPHMSAQEALLTRLAKLRVAPISDILDHMGLQSQVLHPSIRPIVGEGLVGAAYPILVLPSADPDPSGEEGAAAVDAIPQGSVVMIGTGGRRDAASWGELLSTRALARGAAGVVTDGALRDIEGIRRLSFPSYAAEVNARDARGRLGFSAHNLAIVCGEVGVEPGDLVLGDTDGVVVIPAIVAEAVIVDAEARSGTEDLVRTALSKGDPAAEIFAKYGIL